MGITIPKGKFLINSENIIRNIKLVFPELNHEEIRVLTTALKRLGEYNVTWVKGMVIRGHVHTERNSVDIDGSIITTVAHVDTDRKGVVCILMKGNNAELVTPSFINELCKEQLVITENNLPEIKVDAALGSAHIKANSRSKAKSEELERTPVNRPNMDKLPQNTGNNIPFNLGSNRRKTFKKRKGKIKVTTTKFTKKKSGKNRSTKRF